MARSPGLRRRSAPSNDSPPRRASLAEVVCPPSASVSRPTRPRLDGAGWPGEIAEPFADRLQEDALLRPAGGARGERSGAPAGWPLDLVPEIAHDLCSPLTSILTLADALRRGQSGPVNDVQRRQLGLIYSAALGLSSTAANMTELWRNGDPEGEEVGPISIAGILESVRDMLYPMAEEKGLDLRLHSTASDRRLGNGLGLSRVLLNLTTNSLKFTRAGHVEVSARPVGPTAVEFAVGDTGPGMDERALAALYQPFRPRPDGQGYAFSGTGLGLVICRRLLAAMSSSLAVDSRPGCGTRFSFQVDLRRQDSTSL